MSTPVMDELVERVRVLPHLPATILRLVNVASEPGSTLGEIVETIRYDQGITAEVLRLCNSAHFGLARRVESLDDAVRLLGTAKLLQLVLAAHTRALLNRPQAGYGLPAGALWTHSVGVALGAQRLARSLGLAQQGLLFTAGLLHDVGKVALNEYVGQEYGEIVRRVTEERRTFCEAEREVLGYTHPEVGARLAEAWSLPGTIIRCVRYHHEPEALSEPDARVDAVHLADAVCLLMGIGGGDDGLAYRASAEVLRRRGLAQADLELLGADLIAELRSVQAVFEAVG